MSGLNNELGRREFLKRAAQAAAAGAVSAGVVSAGSPNEKKIDAEKEHYFKIKDNSGRVHEILKKNGVPTEYHVLKGKKHYDVYKGQTLDDVMKLEIAWFDKCLKGDK